jgi:hypothetical protein
MNFDAEMLLRDGLVDLDASEAVAISLTRNADGAVALDLRKTAAKGMAAVMILPSAPTTYADTLTALIQQSDALEGNWETIAAFPVLSALLWKVPSLASVAAAVEADLGKLLTGGSTGDTGAIVHIDPALYALNGEGFITVSQVDIGDVFDNTSEAITAATGTFSGVVNGVAGSVAVQVGPGIYVARFAATKQYLRGKYTVSAGGNFGKVLVGLSYHPFKTVS